MIARSESSWRGDSRVASRVFSRIVSLELARGRNPDNVKFMIEHEAELAAMQKEMQQLDAKD